MHPFRKVRNLNYGTGFVTNYLVLCNGLSSVHSARLFLEVPSISYEVLCATSICIFYSHSFCSLQIQVYSQLLSEFSYICKHIFNIPTMSCTSPSHMVIFFKILQISQFIRIVIVLIYHCFPNRRKCPPYQTFRILYRISSYS